MFSKGTAQPVVSAVTQVTKATIYYKSENYTRKFNNAKTAGLCGDVPPFHFFLERELEKSLRNLPHPCLPPPPSLPPPFFPPCLHSTPPPPFTTFFFRSSVAFRRNENKSGKGTLVPAIEAYDYYCGVCGKGFIREIHRRKHVLKSTAQPVVSAVTQVTKATIYTNRKTILENLITPRPLVSAVTFPPFIFFRRNENKKVAKAHWFLQSRRTIIIVAYVERVL